MAEVTSINQIILTARDDTGQALTSVASGLGNVGTQAQKLVDRFDPLSAKIRQAQSDLAALSNAVKVGAFAGQDALIDQIYSQLNANIAQMKTLSDAAGGAMTAGFGAGTRGATELNFATANATREFIVLGHEVMVGNFSRIPGSLLVLTERLGGLPALLNPVTLGIVAIGVATAGFVIAVVKGQAETDKLNASIAATGNFAGTSAADIRALAQSVSDQGTITVGTAQEIMASLTATGKFSIDNIVAITKATDNYAAVTGESATKASEALAKMFEDPAKASEKLNEQYHFLSIAQLEQIKNMQDMGDKQDAINVAVNAFNAALPNHAEHLGTLAKAWDTVTKSISGAIAAVKTWNLGGDTTGSVDAVTHQIAQLQQRIAAPGGDPNGQLATALVLAQQQLATLKQTAQAQSDDNQQQDENIARWKVVTQYSDEYRKQQLQFKLDGMIRLFNPEDANQAAIQLDAMKKIQTEIDNIGKSKGVSGVESALAAMDKELINSQIALDNFGATVDGKTMPALQKLADLEASPVWLKFTQAQKDRAISDAEVAAANEQLLATMTAGHAVAQSVIDTLDKTIASLQLQKVKTDAQIDSLEKYGKANLDSASAVLEFNLANDKQLATLTAMALVNPAVAASLLAMADARIAGARAAAADADASAQEKAAIESLTAEIKKAQESYDKTTDSLNKQADKLVEHAKNLGLTKEQIDQNKIAEDALTLSVDQQALAQARADEAMGTQTANFVASMESRVAADQRLLDAEKGLADKQLAVDTNKAWGDVFNTLANDASSFFQDFEKNGSSAFKKLGDDLVSQIIGALVKLAAQQFILNVTANTSLAGAAQQAFGQSSTNNPIMQLLTGGKGAPGIPGTGGLLDTFETSSVGQALGLSESVGGFSGIAADAVGGIAGPTSAADLALTGAGTALTGAATAIGAAVPYIGIAIAAASALGLFSKSPSQAQGQFQVSPGTTGFEDNAYTHTSLGNLNLGFADANTQQFSGDAAQVFNKIVSGALDAFQSRFSPEQSARLATILQGTTFATESGTFTTQDFLQKYGGQVLQQVVTAAFNVLDPALGSVAANFKGTADEVATFSNSLLGIYDATKQIGNVDFTSKVDAALADATQATADKVLALVTIVSQFGDSITGLGPKIEALNPAQMTAFVDALGGAQTALQSMTYINTNFTTSADKVTAAQALLATDFTNLGLAVPATHQAFLDLLNSFDLATPAGQQLYSQVAALAPLFISVAGTADQAAQALNQLANTGLTYYQQHFLTPAEQLQNRQTVDETQLQTATAAGTTLNDVLRQFGLNIIPSTVQGVRDLVNETIALYGANSDQAKAVEAIIPIIGDLIDSVGGFANAATAAAGQIADAANSISHPVDVDASLQGVATNISNIIALAQGGTGDLGSKLSTELSLFQDKINQTTEAINAGFAKGGNDASFAEYILEPALAQYQAANAAAADELGRFITLSAQYDSARAEQLVSLQDWYTAQQKLFAGQPDVLTSLQDIFQQKWDAIVNGASAAATSLDDFIKSLQQIAQSTQGNQGQQAALQLALAAPKLDTLQAQYAAALPGSALATSILADITKLQAYNTGLATELGHFAVYTAQYGEDVANQLVTLENSYTTWKASVGDNAGALSVLTDIFNEQWQKIIDGTKSGVSSTISQFQQIADYLKGLQVGNISPLTPTDQLAQAKTAFETEFTKALSGDQSALGDVTKFADTYLTQARDYFASSQAYTDIFGSVTSQLGTLAGTTPQGGLLDSGTAAIISALPTNGGKIASSDDMATQTAQLKVILTELITALANANTADSQTATQEIKQSLVAIQEELTAV